jgi:hypothetical protein
VLSPNGRIADSRPPTSTGAVVAVVAVVVVVVVVVMSDLLGRVPPPARPTGN